VLPLAWLAAVAIAQDPFAADVRATPWLTPEEEQAKLHVPDGFTVTCFAREPALWKPMNLAFDARGRLWCTSSTEYPRPVGPDRGFVGRDKITIHEDRDGDGVAETTTLFAEDLNLPIGLLPVVDAAGHDGCIVFSVPNIWRLDDLDGDGKADRRTVLYGPFGWERDAHGLNNSFRRGADGWIYACHGYRNITAVKGRDGHEVRMESGNSYRFRLDGSRIEAFTFGQVNPFGSAFDERGDLYDADCHTLPITLLLQGACYPSFGKPHDGLGFAPQLMSHLHGSTALCGLAIVEGDSFPPEFDGDLLVGDVTRCRIHRDRREWRGSTPVAVEAPDFLVSDDPWFRPVDLQMGPDGALYVADFYNRIIGHYEVALDHPGRDRTSGRIWRIAPPGAAKPAKARDLRVADAAALLAALDDPNPVIRMRALDELTDRVAAGDARAAIEQALRSDRPPSLLVWALLRLDPSVRRVDPFVGESLQQLPFLPRLPQLQALAEAELDDARLRAIGKFAVESLAEADPFVVRAAVHLLGRKPSLATLPPLVKLFARAPADDAMLRHSLKLALRAHLELPHALDQLDGLAVDRATFVALVELGLALHGEAAGRFLIDHAKVVDDPARLQELLAHAAREAAPRDLPRLIATIRDRFADARATQLALLKALLDSADARGVTPDPALAHWAAAIVADVIAADEAVAPPWREAPVAGAGRSANPWCLEERTSADGVFAPFLSSLPRGEKRTGALVSPRFVAPSRLALWLAGHNGELDRDAIPFNKVRVREAAGGAIVAEALAPRNDVAQRIELDLAAAAGRDVVVELVDANPYDAYAWLAAGRFEPPLVAPPQRAPAEASDELVDACAVAGRFRDGALDAALAKLVRARGADPCVRAAAAAALLARGARPIDGALAALLDDPDAPRELVEPVAEAIAARDAAALDSLAARAIELCPGRQQLSLATAWARAPDGARRLVEQVRAGKAAPALLAKPELREAIGASWPEGGAAIDALTAGLASDDEARAALLAERRRGFARYGGDAAKGAAHFAKNCAACHALGGVGATIGPQLDGLAARGFDRVLEDLLDPGRNVDPQFARTNLFLKGGDVRSLLVRRREANALVVVDERGVESTLPLAEIEQERPSRFSLMPDNFGELLGEEEMRDLLAWLIAAR